MDFSHIFSHQNFYALRFAKAKPELLRYMVSRLGLFPVRTGMQPSTNGRCIFMEPVKADFKDSLDELPDNRNLSLYLSDMLHEILHIREGSFLVDGRPFLEKFPNAGLAHTIQNIEDDGRIEFNGRRYLSPNDIELLENSNRFYARKGGQAREKAAATSVPDQLMSIYSCLKIIKGYPSDFNPALTDQVRTALAARVEHPGLQARGLTTAEDVMRQAIDIGNAVYGQPVQAVWQVVPDIYELLTLAFPDIEKKFQGTTGHVLLVPSKGEKSDKGEGAKGEGEGNEGETIQVYLGFRGDGHDFSAADTAGSTLEELVGDFMPQPAHPAAPIGGPKQGGKPTSFQIVTYDMSLRAFTKLKQLEIKPYPNRNAGFAAELGAYDLLRREIVEHFANMRPNALQLVRRSDEPYEVNHEVLVEVLCDPRLRADAKIYDSYKINRRDTLWAILVDISGSTAQPIEEREGKGKRGRGTEAKVIDVEKIAAGLLYQSLTDEEIGDVVLPFAFSSEGMTTLYPLDGLPQIGAVAPERANADGVAIRGVIRVLKDYEAAEKVLCIIADGKPADHDYMGEEAVLDTSLAMAAAEAEGIRVVYFNVDSKKPDYFHTLTQHAGFARWIPHAGRLHHAVQEYVLLHG